MQLLHTVYPNRTWLVLLPQYDIRRWVEAEQISNTHSSNIVRFYKASDRSILARVEYLDKPYQRKYKTILNWFGQTADHRFLSLLPIEKYYARRPEFGLVSLYKEAETNILYFDTLFWFLKDSGAHQLNMRSLTWVV